jgi:predicted membrane metal-binding protein
MDAARDQIVARSCYLFKRLVWAPETRTPRLHHIRQRDNSFNLAAGYLFIGGVCMCLCTIKAIIAAVNANA